MNCEEENPTIISKAVPIGIQDNATFVFVDTLEKRKDLFSDENGSWTMTGCKAKFYSIERNEDGKVVELDKVNSQACADVAVRGRTYICSSYTSYHKTIVYWVRQRYWKKGSHLCFLTIILMVRSRDLRSKSMAIVPHPICHISCRKRAPSWKF